MDWQHLSSSSHGTTNTPVNDWTTSNHLQNQSQNLQYPPPLTSISTPIETGTNTNTNTNADHFPSARHRTIDTYTPAQTALYNATLAMSSQASILAPEAQENINALITTLLDSDIDDMSTHGQYDLYENQSQRQTPIADANTALPLKAAFVEFLFNAMREEGVGRNEILCLLGWVSNVAVGTWDNLVDWNDYQEDGEVEGEGEGMLDDDEMVGQVDENEDVVLRAV